MRRCVALLAFLLLGVIPASAQVPKTVMAEDGTATGCGSCRYAYSGLDRMHLGHDCNEFVSVRYYDSSGGLGNADAQNRLATYGMGLPDAEFPTVWFSGTSSVVGGTAAIATGVPYQSAWEQALGPSPFKMRFQVFNPASAPGTGRAQVRIDCVSPPGDIAGMAVKIVVYEDAVPYTDPSEGFRVHYEVTRDILDPVPLAAANLGDFQVVDKIFPVDATWVAANVHAIALIQEEGPNASKADDPIRQACSSVSLTNPPQYSMTYYAEGEKLVVAPLNTAYSFGNFAFRNAGTDADTFTVRLTAERAPAGWTAEFTDGTSTYTNEVQLPLNAGDARAFHLNVTPKTLDYGKYRIEIFSNNLPANGKTVRYMIIAEGVCALAVDDDGGETYEQYYTAALDSTGYSYAVWPYAEATVPVSIMHRFKAVIWYTAAENPSLSAADRTALATYLNGGGRLFITGQDVGWDLARPPDAAHGDPGGKDPTFYTSYLHAAYVSDDSGSTTLTGVAGDPIGDGLSFCISCGDGAGYTPYPDSIRPFDSFASDVLIYSTGASGGIKADTGTNKVVYLSFGFETIGDPASRATLMTRIIGWLGACRAAADCPAGTPSTVALTMSKPNANDIQLDWPADASAVGGFDVYSTDDKTVVTRLRRENSYTPVTTFPAGTTSSTLPMAGGMTYYQMVGACNNNVEGPN